MIHLGVRRATISRGDTSRFRWTNFGTRRDGARPRQGDGPDDAVWKPAVARVAGLAARLIGGIATLALTLFVLPLFCGAAYLATAFVQGLLRGAPFDAPLAGLCAVGLPLTGVAVWIPLRRLIEALRSGPARVELPVEDLQRVR